MSELRWAMEHTLFIYGNLVFSPKRLAQLMTKKPSYQDMLSFFRDELKRSRIL